MKTHQLIFREDWAEIPPARPITQEHIANPELVLSLYGPGQSEIKKSHHEELENDPYYVWSGKCSGKWALVLSHRQLLIDFSAGGLFRLSTRQSGSRCLHLILKPEQSTWFISVEAIPASSDWQESTLDVENLTWRPLDIATVEAQEGRVSPAMHRIDSIGFTDLMAGGNIENCSRVDWIEVWGQSTARHQPLPMREAS